MAESLDALVRHYSRHYRPALRGILDGFHDQPFDVAIRHAATAREGDGTKRRHDWRKPEDVLVKAYAVVRTVQDALLACDDFDCLLELIEETAGQISGIGPLYCYDTALRISAHRGRLPEKVYLHAGTRKGAERLLNKRLAGRRSLDPDELPEELRLLEPYELEDFLCLYKDKFNDGEEDVPGTEPPAKPRGRC